MPDYVIKTDFRAADRLSPVLKRIGINVEKLGNDATRSFRRASRGASVFGGVLKGVLAAGVVSRGFMYAGMGVRSLGETFLEFDKNTTSAIAKLRNNLDRSSLAFTKLGKSAREAATVTEFSAGDTSKAVEQLVMAGLNENQVLAALTPTLNLATNAAIDVSEATRMAMKSLGAFGLRVDDAAQLQKNLTRVNNVFARAVSDSTLEMQDLFEVLTYAGPAMAAAGQSIETFSAASAILADNSIDASIAGTSLRMAFLRLAGPPASARRWIKKLGLQIADSSGNFLDFADVIEQLQGKIAKYGNVRRLQIMKELFGVRAQNAMNILVREGADKLRTYRASLDASGGAGQRMAKIMRDSIIARLLQLKSNLIELGFKFIETFAEKGGKGIDRLTRAVRNFDPKPLIKDLKTIAGVFRDYILPNLDLIVAGFVTWEIAVSSVKWLAFLQFAQALAPALFATKGAAALMLLDAAAVLILAGAIALVTVKNDTFVAATERGYMQMEIAALKLSGSIKNIFAEMFNWIIDKMGVVLTLANAGRTIANKFGGHFDRIEPIDLDEDKKYLKERERQLKELQNEASAGIYAGGPGNWLTLFGGGAQTGLTPRGGPPRRGPQFTTEEIIGRNEQLMRDLSKMDISDPAKSMQAIKYLVATAEGLNTMYGLRGKDIPGGEPEFKPQSAASFSKDTMKLDINVYADEGFMAQYNLNSKGGGKSGKSKVRKAHKLSLDKLGYNQ